VEIGAELVLSQGYNIAEMEWSFINVAYVLCGLKDFGD